MQIFELDGYLRLRTDYMHQFFLGQGYYAAANTNIPNVNYGLPPFPVPLDCPRPNAMTMVTTIPSNCPSKNIGGANLRFRLEPTLNVTDQVRVHAQIDVLDNTIMGSTPDSLAGIEGYNRPVSTGNPIDTPSNPSGFLSNNQDPPEVGQNGFLSSIRAK